MKLRAPKKIDVEQSLHLTMNGVIVLSVGMFGWDGGKPPEEELGSEVKADLDELHKQKIDLSDSILVLNVDGYIGDSTRSEIEYAEANGVEVAYLESEMLNEEDQPLDPPNNTIINMVKEVLIEHVDEPMSLDKVHWQLRSRGLNRRQVRSALGNACRDYSSFYRIGEATFIYTNRKPLEYKDGRTRA